MTGLEIFVIVLAVILIIIVFAVMLRIILNSIEDSEKRAIRSQELENERENIAREMQQGRRYFSMER